ncbi:MAG TPA: glucose-1-phosphate thymidylyltransferase, partial [bacterium]|nr:glucose-1-phosphate thymidylyltransferase [bacterium]
MILSGGKGTRLRPITHTSAKQLVPIANKPILFYGIEAIRDAGITDIGIIVGDTASEIEAAVGDGSKFGVRVTYIQQDAPLGLAHAVKTAKGFVGRDRFVVYLGDNLITEGVKEFVERFAERGPNCQILLAHVPNPQDFGVAELSGDRVVRLVEKPREPKTDLALVGVYMFDETVFAAADAIKPSWRNELEITDAIQYLIDQGRDVQFQIISGWWKDTGKLEDILEANGMLLGRLVTRVDGQVDDRSKLDGTV